MAEKRGWAHKMYNVSGVEVYKSLCNIVQRSSTAEHQKPDLSGFEAAALVCAEKSDNKHVHTHQDDYAAKDRYGAGPFLGSFTFIKL